HLLAPAMRDARVLGGLGARVTERGRLADELLQAREIGGEDAGVGVVDVAARAGDVVAAVRAAVDVYCGLVGAQLDAAALEDRGERAPQMGGEGAAHHVE